MFKQTVRTKAKFRKGVLVATYCSPIYTPAPRFNGKSETKWYKDTYKKKAVA